MANSDATAGRFRWVMRSMQFGSVALCIALFGCGMGEKTDVTAHQTRALRAQDPYRPAVVIIDAKTLLDTRWPMEGPGFVVEVRNYQSLDQMWADASWYVSEHELQAKVAGRRIALPAEAEFLLHSLWERGLPRTYVLREGALPPTDLSVPAVPDCDSEVGTERYVFARLPGQQSGTAGVLIPAFYSTAMGPLPEQHIFVRDVSQLSSVLKESRAEVMVPSDRRKLTLGGYVEGWPHETIQKIRGECDIASVKFYRLSEPTPK